MQFEKPTHADLANRFTHCPPTGEQIPRYERIRSSIIGAAESCVGVTPCCPEQSRALNALDEAMFLFNAAIARHEKAD